MKLSDPKIKDGFKFYSVRERIPFSFFSTSKELQPETEDRTEEFNAEKDTETFEVEKAEDVAPDERARKKPFYLEGVASSTSIDSHGTEMSLKALTQMMNQFKDGVVYLPTHAESEWDQVMGMTTDAEIVQSKVEKAHHETEKQYVLKTHVKLYRDHPKTERLMTRLKRGEKIGMSVGGWFTDLTVVSNEETDEIERVIVEAVELDHLATTRRPSNPDSYMTSFRSKFQETLQEGSNMQKEEIENRHIMEVKEHDDAYEIKFGKSMMTESKKEEKSDIENSENEVSNETPETVENVDNNDEIKNEISELKSQLSNITSALQILLSERTEKVETETEKVEVERTEKVEVETEKDDSLLKEIELLRSKVSELEAAPVRRGIANQKAEQHIEERGSYIERQIEKMPEGKLKEEMIRQLPNRTSKTAVSRRNLVDDLATLFRAAIDDGIMRQPEQNASKWNK